MFSTRWKKIGRDLSTNLSRTMLVVLSIAVGIFATGAILGARQVLLREFERDFASSNKASFEIYVNGVKSDLVDRIGARSDVIAAEGRRTDSVRLRDVTPGKASGNWESLEMNALPNYDMKIDVTEPIDVTAWPPRSGEIIIEASALAAFDFKVGDTVEVDNGVKQVKLRVSGFSHDINAIPARFFRQVTGYISMDTLRLFEEPEEFNTISVSVNPRLGRIGAARIATDIRDTILTPSDIVVQRMSVPDPGSHFFGDIFKAVSVLLLIMAFMALALSVFLVITTVSAILVQQTRQLGIMKAVGARKWQIARMYFGMVFCFGALALVLGLPLGLVFGRAFIEYAATVLNFRVIDYTFPLWVMLLLVSIALILPLAAAAVPIISGVRRPIVQAFNATALLPDFGEGRIDRFLSGIRWLPRPSALALRTTFTRKKRLALTLTTLVLASAVVMAVFSARASLLQTVDDVGSWWNYDAMVMLSQPAPQATLESEALKIKGVEYAETWLDGRSIINRPDGTKNENYFTVAYPATTKVLDFQYVLGRAFEPGEKGVIINSELYNDETYLVPGAMVSITINGQDIMRPVIGVVTGSLSGPAMYFERDDLATLSGIPGSATRVLVKMDPDLQGKLVFGKLDSSLDSMRGTSQQRLADELESALDAKNYSTSTTQTSVKQLDTTRGQLGILVTFLIIMASALAAVGVIGLSGSMTLSVIESTREIGIMRSIGASHLSIFGIYITQGMVVGTLSWFLGAILSYPLSWLLIQALVGAIGMPLSYRFSWGGIGVWLILVWAISIGGSVLPAWRASQVSIRDAISYE